MCLRGPPRTAFSSLSFDCRHTLLFSGFRLRGEGASCAVAACPYTVQKGKTEVKA
jgi:hypothetical protein